MNDSPQIERGSMRLAGWAGVLSVLLVAVAALLVQMWDSPATGSTSAQIASSVHANRSGLLAGMVLNTLGVALWLFFGAGVWLRLRQVVGPHNLLLACFVLGFAAFVTLIFAGFTPFFVLAYRAPHVGDARTLYDLAFGLLAISAAPTTMSLGAYAALVYRHGGLPRWTAELAAIGATAHVVLLGSFLVSHGFFSLEGGVIIAIPATLFAWILGTSWALLRVARA